MVILELALSPEVSYVGILRQNITTSPRREKNRSGVIMVSFTYFVVSWLVDARVSLFQVQQSNQCDLWVYPTSLKIVQHILVSYNTRNYHRKTCMNHSIQSPAEDTDVVPNSADSGCVIRAVSAVLILIYGIEELDVFGLCSRSIDLNPHGLPFHMPLD